MKFYIGIDGGGTKTSFILADEKGFVISKVVTGTTHYMQVGLDGLENIIREGVSNLLDKTNISLDNVSSVFVATGGFGAIKDDEKDIIKAIRNVFKNNLLKVGNDMENAHSASLSGECGINVIAGTGSIGLGINEANESYSTGGWGPSFGGDEGSAYWIACKLLLEFSKEADNRSEKTEIYDYFINTYKLSNPFDILKYTNDRTKIASFAKDCYNLAKLGNTKAINIYKLATKELALIYKTIYNNLNFNGTVKASYTGGVFNAIEYTHNFLLEELKDTNINLVKPRFTTDIGSLLLAYKNDNIIITNEILNNLEKTYN